MTVRSPTVTSRCCALLLSTFFNLGLDFLWLFFLIGVSFSLFSFSTFSFSTFSFSTFSFSLSFSFSFFSFFTCVGGTNCWVTCCETNWATGRGFLVFLFLFSLQMKIPPCWFLRVSSWFSIHWPGCLRVDVPFLTSHIMHLKASAPLRKVQTLQSQ